MIDNLDSVRYKKQINTLVDRIKEIVDNSNYNDDLRKFLQNYSEICKREKVYIVFAGEYSTGKSSIIRALTGDSSIKISEEPTTDKEIVYNYNSYCVVDTPGLYSGNNNHDSIANDAYKKPIMWYFVFQQTTCSIETLWINLSKFINCTVIG